HQSAARALERMEVPRQYRGLIAQAMRTLIAVYKDERDSHPFLLECISLYTSRYLTDSANGKQLARIFVALCFNIEADLVVRELRYISRKLSTADGYTELIVGMLSNERALSYLEKDILEMLSH